MLLVLIINSEVASTHHSSKDSLQSSRSRNSGVSGARIPAESTTYMAPYHPSSVASIAKESEAISLESGVNISDGLFSLHATK